MTCARPRADELGAATEPQARVPADTTTGHTHLQVADIGDAEAFYHGVLGFDVTARGYPGALFVSAGGYHHHIGLNTWHSAGAAPAATGSVGLRSFEVIVPDHGELGRVADRIRDAGLERVTESDDRVSVRDPSGNLVVLRSR